MRNLSLKKYGAFAEYKNAPMSPLKLRVVADAIRGKKCMNAVDILSATPGKGSQLMLKVLKSAIANAKQDNIDIENLSVDSVLVNEGNLSYNKPYFGSRSRFSMRKKRFSHITINLL